ncbi:hypothetical protein EV426DRAFT_707790 [Tirmania nivea]|nr:hypothetical protein EV426DRAFT_707790 [Tirmania nivea]
MRPHRLVRPSCLARTHGAATSTGAPPCLPFLYPSNARCLTSAPPPGAANPPSQSPPHDPWSFLLGRPDPSAPPPPIFNHYRSPPSPPPRPLQAPLCQHQQHLHIPTAAKASGHASPYAPPRPPLDPTYSTITERERAIFSAIFESILSESPSPSNLSSSPSDPPPRHSAALTALFESAVGPQFAQNQVSFGPSYTASPNKASALTAAMARASAIADYPPSLRLAAAHAAGLPGIPLTESESKQEATRQSQLLHLVTKMDSCDTDLDVLTFLDTHVFSMITSPESHSTDTLYIKGRKFVFPSASYADLLAHALRLLLRTFRDLPSTLYVFQRIKSLGPESYVVGCNINIYNLILTAKWEAYRSIGIISEALDEMRINGIEGDRETVEVLRAVCLDALGNWRIGGLGALGDREVVDLGKVENTMREMSESIKEREREAEREKLRARSVREGSAGLGMALGLEGRRKTSRGRNLMRPYRAA